MTTSRLRDKNHEEISGGGITPPIADKRRTESIHHGIVRTDDYGWLRAANWQQVMRDPAELAPEIRAHLEAENAYAAAAMADVEPLRQALVKEMRARIKEDDSSVPATDGPFAYGMRYLEGAEHPRLVRTPREGGEETVLLDGNAMAVGKAYFRLGGADHSPDHRLLAYAVDETGSEFYELRFRDTATGEDLPDRVPATTGGAVWASDGRTVFYVQVDDNHRPAKVFRHVVGTDPAGDALVYAEANSGFFVGVGQTQSRKYIVISSHDHETSEAHILPAARPEEGPVMVAPRRTAEEYRLDHSGDRFYILTNAGASDDYKIVTAPESAPGRENWRDLVPHSAGRLILHATAYRDWLVRLERENGLPRIIIRRLSDSAEHAIGFDEEAYALGMLDGYEFDTDMLRFTYSSMTTPARVFDYDMAKRTRVLRKQDVVPSGHNPDDYITRRIFATATDGETVPISLVYRRDTPLDGSAPALLYGYGSYGIAMPAAFSTTRLSLVDRGFVYAIAHIRGGKDKGFRWYAEGRRGKKANTFNDYVAAAEYLIAESFTARGRIVGWGGSAGGLLMGAAANMAPDLFAAIIAEVPFVDVLATMLDDSLPLTPPEWPEWGNPAASEADYRTIAAYSPYDNVRRQAYPAILALAGLTDPRVTYWEPAKWVARLREMNTGDRPLVLRTNMDAGHGGAAGRFDRLQETALATVFALKAVGRA